MTDAENYILETFVEKVRKDRIFGKPRYTTRSVHIYIYIFLSTGNTFSQPLKM